MGKYEGGRVGILKNFGYDTINAQAVFASEVNLFNTPTHKGIVNVAFQI